MIHARRLLDPLLAPSRTAKTKIRYRTVQMSGRQVRLEIVDGFYSDAYGTCVIGFNKERLITRLSDKLQQDYGIIGTLIESDNDDADKVGKRSSAILSVERKSCDYIGRGRILLGAKLRQEEGTL